MFCPLPELLGLHDSEAACYFYPHVRPRPQFPPPGQTDLTVAIPEFWFAAVFIAAHSLQWRAHAHYHAMQYLDRHGVGGPEGAMQILACQRLGVLRSIRHLAAVSRDAYAVVAGTIPFMDCSRPRCPPTCLGRKLTRFLKRGLFPDPTPSTFPLSIPPSLVHAAGPDYPCRPHPRALYAHARYLTMWEAWHGHLPPATYPVQWSLWEQLPVQWSLCDPEQLPQRLQGTVALPKYHRRASSALLEIQTDEWTKWYFRRAFQSSRHHPTLFPTQMGFNRVLTDEMEEADAGPAWDEGAEGPLDDSADAFSGDPGAASSADHYHPASAADDWRGPQISCCPWAWL